jgi:peptide/nickel transport system substrate-binding protein
VDERRELVEQVSMTVNENFVMSYHGSTLAVLAAQDFVKNVDGWTFPDGTEGTGTPGATTHWAFVWTTE